MSAHLLTWISLISVGKPLKHHFGRVKTASCVRADLIKTLVPERLLKKKKPEHTPHLLAMCYMFNKNKIEFL